MKCLIGLIDVQDENTHEALKTLSRWHGVIESVFSSSDTSYYIIVNIDKLIAEKELLVSTSLWNTIKQLVSEEFTDWNNHQCKCYHNLESDTDLLAGFLVKELE